jgi:hypothetical protein
MSSQTEPIRLQDRRRRRSTDALVAMRYQLTHVMEEFGLDACVIATHEGLLLASPLHLETEQCELLAAIAPAAWRDPDGVIAHRALEAAGVQVDGSMLRIQEFSLLGQQMLIVTVGSHAADKERGIFRSVLGVRRILDQAA